MLVARLKAQRRRERYYVGNSVTPPMSAAQQSDVIFVV
jgi:hypothetical protein